MNKLRPRKKMQIGGDYEEDNKFNSAPAYLRPQPSYGFVGPMQPAVPNYGPMGPFNYDNSPGLINDCPEGMIWDESLQKCTYDNGYDPTQEQEKNKPKGRGIDGMGTPKTGPGTGVNPQNPAAKEKKYIDPYFSLRGATTGLSWLAGVVARNRQNQYARDEFSTLGQIGAKNVNGFQPNRYNLYAQKGGKLPPITVDNPEELLKEVKKNARYQHGGNIKAQIGKLFPGFTSSYDFGPVKPDPQLKSASKNPVKVQVNQGKLQPLSNLQMLSRMTLDGEDMDPNFEKLNEMQKTYWTSRDEYETNEYKNNHVGKTDNFIKLTSGRFNGANVPSALLDSAIATSKRKNIPFGKLATLMGRESTFGAGENIKSQLRSGNLKDVISVWNVDESYRPYNYARFLADNKVPGIMGIKSKYGLDYYINNKDKVEEYLKNNPKIIESYNKKLTSQPKLNNQNALDLAVDFINKKGISEYNPGDSDYTNKFNKDYNLLANDKALAKYLSDRGVKFKKGGLTPNKARQILHDKKVHGKPLTDKQRRLFGAMSEGHTLKY